ncbi:peptidylprolyl isomerase [Candidatus Thioglobus sp.]|nr:peptidylprolyl isomerase [Candidatus Thioglobus sp.]
MKVTKDKVVSMHYTLKNDVGDVIDSSEGKETMDFLQGHGNIIPGLETALEGSKKGDKVEVSIEPEEGYGLKMDDAIQEIPRTALQGIDEVKIGMQLQSQDQDGNPFVVTVIKLDDEKITVDANHPLAGETLHFSVSIEDVRDALEEEVSHGHAHSAGGHSH